MKVLSTKKIALAASALGLFAQILTAGSVSVKSPDGLLKVEVCDEGGSAYYSVSFKGKTLLENSPLGFVLDSGDFKSDLAIKSHKLRDIKESYSQAKIKKSKIDYAARELSVNFSAGGKREFSAIFRVSNNNVAFRYFIPKQGDTACARVLSENTGFKFPQGTKTFMSPQMAPMTGWKRSAPSYEAPYHFEGELGRVSDSKNGWIFPALFRVDSTHWVLLSETGVDGNYCACKLGDADEDKVYRIAFPNPAENNGNGTVEPAFSLPGYTPWRTITVGDSLKPIVETTVAWDVVKPLYESKQNYKFGRSTWSWIVWQDPSMNWDDQVKFIDLASAMGFEYILIDAGWDVNIGYEKMRELIKYANSKKVDVLLWYSSSGYWNDIVQTPVNKMDNPIIRKREMKWLKEANVKGIKVDFFGGDKQETMRLYEQILSDADDFGIMVFFHGTTMPRGWERMYPNYVGSEAVIASEALIFGQWACDNMSYFASMHPFVRNATGCMEFGGTFMNKRLNRNNDGGSVRKTSDVAELAISILFQNPIQALAITPNNLEDAPKICMDFLRQLPTTWDDTQFIDGYPGKYSVIARRHDKTWYVAGVSASAENLKLKLNLPMLKGRKVLLYSDGEGEDRAPQVKEIRIPLGGTLELPLERDGGFVIKGR